MSAAVHVLSSNLINFKLLTTSCQTVQRKCCQKLKRSVLGTAPADFVSVSVLSFVVSLVLRSESSTIFGFLGPASGVLPKLCHFHSGLDYPGHTWAK